MEVRASCELPQRAPYMPAYAWLCLPMTVSRNALQPWPCAFVQAEEALQSAIEEFQIQVLQQRECSRRLAPQTVSTSEDVTGV